MYLSMLSCTLYATPVRTFLPHIFCRIIGCSLSEGAHYGMKMRASGGRKDVVYWFHVKYRSHAKNCNKLEHQEAEGHLDAMATAGTRPAS